MPGRLSLVLLLPLLASACAAGTATPSPSVTATTPAATQTAVPASPTPSATASAAPAEAPTATASASVTDALAGTWATGQTTCADQNAALETAGFTAEQLRLGRWDATCGDMKNGSQFTIRFEGGVLAVFIDGSHEWGDGEYRIVDDNIFEARDEASAEWYLTYEFAIDGDQLTIDMIEDDYPADSEAELMGERIAQTVIYETSAFSRRD